MDLKSINNIYITGNHRNFAGKFIFETSYVSTSYYNRGCSVKEEIDTFDLARLIVSMGGQKIKNVLTKDFAAEFKDSGRLNKYIPIWNTKEEAEAALEWLKQKCLETELIGKDTIETEQRKKNIEAEQKKKKKERKKADLLGKETENNIQQYIGQIITIPVRIEMGYNDSTLQLKTKLLGFKFNYPDYEISTEAGDLIIDMNEISLHQNKFMSEKDKRCNDPKVKIKGSFLIEFPKESE